MAKSYISNGIHREKLSISSNAWHLSNTWRWLNPCGMWGWDVSLKFRREARVEGRCTDSFLDRLTIAIPTTRTWNEKVYHAFAIVSEMNHSCLADWKRKYVSPWNIITYLSKKYANNQIPVRSHSERLAAQHGGLFSFLPDLHLPVLLKIKPAENPAELKHKSTHLKIGISYHQLCIEKGLIQKLKGKKIR
jgi:hypothetical protein